MSAAFLLTWAAALVSPGPDLLLVLRLAATGSRPRALAAAVGIVAGIAAWVLLAIGGIAAVLATRPALMDVLMLLGGAFLLWMGASGIGSWLRPRVGALRTAADRETAEAAPDDTADDEPDGRSPAVRAFAAGLATNLSNPKALVFFGALFAGFVPSDATAGAYAVLVAVMLAMAAAWFGFVAAAASHPAVLRRIRRATAVIDVLAAVAFVAIGGVMVAEGLAGLTGAAA